MQIQVWNKEMELLSRDEAEPPPFLNPPVKIRLEFGYGVEAHQLNELDRAIREKILQSYQIQCVLEFLPPESLGRVTKKTPLFEKVYER